MIRKLQLLTMAVMLMLAMPLSGQKKLQKADKQFEMKAFYAAEQTYSEIIEKDPGHLYARLQLAECQRLTNQLVKSLKTYNPIIDQVGVGPDYYFTYGQLLKKVAKYDKAKAYFTEYKTYNPIEGEHFALSCDFALNLLQEGSKYDLSILNINTPYSDYGISFKGDEAVIASFRAHADQKDGDDLLGNQLYVADRKALMKFNNVQKLRPALKRQQHLGPVSYAYDSNLCAYTKNKVEDGGFHVYEDDYTNAIYLAQAEVDGDFSNEIPFIYNEAGSSTAFPCLAYRGDALYFASNRPGGFGGYDLYVSYFKENRWSYPQNLGERINTPGNEITPFFDEVSLMFASDYHPGLGGYDILSTQVTDGKWDYPVNMGNGINSPGDDYYPSKKYGEKSVYFSSNRLGGKGKDDIYVATPLAQQQYYSSVVHTANKMVDVPQAVELPTLKSQTTPKASIQSGVVLVGEEESKTSLKVSKDENRAIGTKDQISPQVEMEAEVTKVIAQAKEAKQQSEALSPTKKSGETISKDDKVKRMIRTEASEESNLQIGKEQEVNAPDAFKIPDLSGKSTASNVHLSNNSISLSGARMVALDELLPSSPVYFIQLASVSRTKGNMSGFKRLSKYGNIYRVYKPSTTKIRLGYFLDKTEALKVLKNVKSSGFKDAFITQELLNTSELELVVSNNTVHTPKDKNTGVTPEYWRGKSKYKVRLASYEDPIWFDVDSAKDLGRIEQWTKGGWTIFILSGYNSLEEATDARRRSVNRGFADASIVIDNNGVLQALKQN